MLPKGLSFCPFCGDVRGKSWGRVSLCLCDGLTCGYCGLGRIRRPTSDHYDPDTRTFWHTPYFGGALPCRSCSRLAHEVDPDASYPGPLRDDKALCALLATLGEAHRALAADQASPAAEPDDGAIVAVHAPEAAWRRLALPVPPDDRPLWIGVATDFIQPPLRSAMVASWEPPAGYDPGELVFELDDRWRPPFGMRPPWHPLESDLDWPGT